MAVETDTERAIFFDTDDFASSATFTDVSAGTSSTIKGIFDKESVEQAVGDGYEKIFKANPSLVKLLTQCLRK